jgi:hypothetical protein
MAQKISLPGCNSTWRPPVAAKQQRRSVATAERGRPASAPGPESSSALSDHASQGREAACVAKVSSEEEIRQGLEAAAAQRDRLNSALAGQATRVIIDCGFSHLLAKHTEVCHRQDRCQPLVAEKASHAAAGKLRCSLPFGGAPSPQLRSLVKQVSSAVSHNRRALRPVCLEVCRRDVSPQKACNRPSV